MFLIERKDPEELLYYQALSRRRGLDKKSEEHLWRLRRGAAGERTYDLLFDEAGHSNLYVFRDLYLLIEGSVTQYDTLIVSESGITVNEIKNFSGDYRVEGTTWYRGDYALPDDALSQLRRAVGKLVRLKRAVSFEFEVSGKLVFPHEEFRLSGGEGSLFQHLVMRYDMRRYFRSFENEYSGGCASELADVIERHIVPNPYFKLRVEFDMVRQGLYCGGCGSFRLEKQSFHHLCLSCGSRESNETHLVRAISDFKYLFGDLEMTSRRMMGFTGGAVNVRTLQRILNKYCDAAGRYKSSNYIFKYYDFTEAMKKEQNTRKYKDYLN